jgi:hypothetical protein
MTVKSIQSSDPETTGSHRSEPLSHEKKSSDIKAGVQRTKRTSDPLIMIFKILLRLVAALFATATMVRAGPKKVHNPGCVCRSEISPQLE